MGDAIRCPSCGGLNPAGAEWCGQCLTRFRARSAPPPPPPPPGAKAASPSAVVAPGRRGAFTVGDEGITWHCSRCETENPLEASVCVVCGTNFADVLRPPPQRPERDPNTVALYSLFFPGAGHWYLDMKGQGLARGIVSTWVVVVALLAAVGGAGLMAVLFGVAAFGLWLAGAHDAYREARGEVAMVLLKPRVFVYLVLGLLVLMMVLLVSAGFRAGAT